MLTSKFQIIRVSCIHTRIQGETVILYEVKFITNLNSRTKLF